jgi:RimJ/RimL family protein N-acetyltransferase
VGYISNYCFENMGLKRLFAPVLSYNKGSMKVLEKNGFILEGIFRNHFNKKDQLWDAHYYAKVIES